MASRWIVLDVASAAIADAATYIDKSVIEAPDNYVNQDAIDRYVEKEYAKRLDKAGLDIDLARITCIGIHADTESGINVTQHICQTEDDEREALDYLKRLLGGWPHTPLITFGGLRFDIPLLMRRAKYLGVNFAKINTHPYQSQNIDLMAELSDRDKSRMRSLNFYCTRLGWTDCPKALSGEEEAKVHATGRWEALRASVARDVEVTRRLAAWLGVI